MTKVLIVSDQSIFGQGLEGLLRREQGIDLVDQVASPDALPGCLEQCRPDVVFFGCSDPASCSAPVFIQALRDGLVRRIICVNLEDNAVYVFRGERHAVEKVEDLVEAITGQIPGALPFGSCCRASAVHRGKEEYA